MLRVPARWHPKNSHRGRNWVVSSEASCLNLRPVSKPVLAFAGREFRRRNSLPLDIACKSAAQHLVVSGERLDLTVSRTVKTWQTFRFPVLQEGCLHCQASLKRRCCTCQLSHQGAAVRENSELLRRWQIDFREFRAGRNQKRITQALTGHSCDCSMAPPGSRPGRTFETPPESRFEKRFARWQSVLVGVNAVEPGANCQLHPVLSRPLHLNWNRRAQRHRCILTGTPVTRTLSPW